MSNEGEFEMSVEHLKNHAKALPTSLEKAKYFIAEHKDTRVRSIQQYLKINSNEMKTVYDELVKESWLEKPVSSRSGYKILVDDDVLGEFKLMFVNSFENDND